MSACVCGGGEEGLWGQEVLPRHVKGDSQPGTTWVAGGGGARGRVGGE